MRARYVEAKILSMVARLCGMVATDSGKKFTLRNQVFMNQVACQHGQYLYVCIELDRPIKITRPLDSLLG